MKKEAGVHRLGQATCEGRAVLPWYGGGRGSLRQVLCRVRAPKPIPSPSPAQESRTWTSGAPSSQDGLTPVLLASNQKTVSQGQTSHPLRLQGIPFSSSSP